MIDKDENKADELPEVGRRDWPRRHSSTARVEAVLRHARTASRKGIYQRAPKASILLMSCHPVRGRIEPR